MQDNELLEAAEKAHEKYRYTADWVSFYLGFLEGMKYELLDEATRGQNTITD